MKKIVPTRDALQRKMVQIEDGSCLFCRGELETDVHLFKNCNVIACLWMLYPIGLRARNHSAGDVWDWVAAVAGSLKGVELDVFFLGLWTIWEERNKLLWQGGVFNPQHACAWSMKLLQEYQHLHPRKQGQRRRGRGVKKWERPPQGRLKINTDGAFDMGRNGGGLGWVARDGGVISWQPGPRLLHTSARHCIVRLRHVEPL